MIMDADLFDEPTADQGWPYTKPEKYLAAACLDSGVSREAVASAIADMVACKYSPFLCGAQTSY